MLDVIWKLKHICSQSKLHLPKLQYHYSLYMFHIQRFSNDFSYNVHIYMSENSNETTT